MPSFDYKILGQSNPTPNTLVTIYTVPSGNSAIVSTITLANIGADNALYKLAVQKNGAAIESNHYIAYNTTISSFDTAILTLGLTLGAGDVLSANVSSANLSINVFGTETY